MCQTSWEQLGFHCWIGVCFWHRSAQDRGGVGAGGGAVGRQAHKRLQVREQGHWGAVKLFCCSVRCHIYQLLVFLGALLKGPPLTPASVSGALNQSCHSTDARSSRGHCLNMKCPPQAPWVWSPLVALFGKIIEPLGGGASLEVVGPWGQTLRSYLLVPLPVYGGHMTPPSCPCRPAFPSCCHVFTAMVSWIHFGTVNPNQPS